jgi:glycosyltransferase involved in cell wall biosynthesis
MTSPPIVHDTPTILHICSDYAKQRLYSELFSNLASLGLRQYIYVPVRSAAEVGKYHVDKPELEFRYASILQKYHRILFRLKIRTIFDDVTRNVGLGQFRLTHAHFLYSDGAVARVIQKQTGIRYVVSVRNTDINFFMKWRPDLRWLCWDILRNASKVIFLSPSYSKLLSKCAPMKLRDSLQAKSIIIPNGLDSSWLRDGPNQERSVSSTLRILYVGDFSTNKNLLNAITAVSIVNKIIPVTFTIVGGGGDQDALLRKQCKSGDWPFVTHLERIEDRSRLREIYRSHDVFLMPSHFETFGLVYIEALSQGLPVVHSLGQGIDGYFKDDGISVAVDPKSPTSIAEGIIVLANRLPATRTACVMAARYFDWKDIAIRYQLQYQSALS